MKTYEKILLFVMIVLLTISFTGIMTSAKSSVEYDNSFLWGTSSWEHPGSSNEALKQAFKPIDFGDVGSNHPLYISFSISDIPETLNDYISITLQSSTASILLGSTYTITITELVEGKYYTVKPDYLSSSSDSRYIIITIRYDYSLTSEDLEALNSITVDICKWYSNPYGLFTTIEDLEAEVEQLRNERDSLQQQLNQLYIDYDLLLEERSYWRQQYNVVSSEYNALNETLNLKLQEITTLKNEIAILEEEIQEKQEALELEYYRGFDEGYVIGHDYGYNKGISVNQSEAYEQGFIDGQKSKLIENNEKFYNGIEKWLVPAIITVIALGGFVTIAARKRREE